MMSDSTNDSKVRVRLLSDIHLEFNQYEVDFKERADVCLLAGDIGNARTRELRDFVGRVAVQHELTIFVPGNHEYYDSNVEGMGVEDAREWMHGPMKRAAEKWGNRLEVFAPHGAVEFRGVPFIGGTLWTDFSHASPVAMEAARGSMADYRWINTGSGVDTRRFLPEDALAENGATRSFLENKLDELDNARTVVVSHHAPLWECNHPSYGRDHISSAFCNSGLEPWFTSKQFAVWCHGHCHVANRLDIAGKRVYSNARGYIHFEQVKGHDPEFIFEV